ncbi:Transcriptional regulator of nonfermentable carbon utilization [Quaeritorhiza haematococci]|nr:Transcriptional regulator of nonfermentable carbon utilization [Quaeritorhiza haematococci]
MSLPTDFTFGSETVNLEYSILSNMLAAPVSTTAISPPNAYTDILFGGVGVGSGGGRTDGALGGGSNSGQEWTKTATAPGARQLPTTSQGTSAQLFTSSHSSGKSHVDVYTAVKRPYDYREGFHYLVTYVKERMEKNDIMRICKALAGFRPSFMAQIMNLSEEDLIFMEKCFQRTLLEFEKLISCSGTPTVVWRRTGEIALVGEEFSILTRWSRDQLMAKRTYIYELMDNASAVNYWEKFSLIAFDNSQQSVMTTCTLMSPPDEKTGVATRIPCTFCFTIKRDIFDVPLAIISPIVTYTFDSSSHLGT